MNDVNFEIKMVRVSIIIAVIVLLLGLLSVGAGFAAELTRVKGSEVKIVDGKCVHPKNPVMALAIIAAVAAVLLRVVVRVAAGRGYTCCWASPNLPKLIRYCIFCAWLMSFVAVAQFIAGAKLSNRKDLRATYTGPTYKVQYECYVLKAGVFSTAAFESLISLCLTLFYYLVIALTQNVPSNKPLASELEAPSVTNDHQRPPSVANDHQRPPTVTNDSQQPSSPPQQPPSPPRNQITR